MNRNNDILTGLLKEKDTIRMQIAGLEADLEAVDRLLNRFSRNQQIEMPISTKPLQPQPNALGLTEAVKDCFERYPNKQWSPAELRDRLKEMKRRGELKSEAKDFLPTIHVIIKKLINDDFVKLAREQSDPVRKWYKKIIAMNDVENESKLVEYEVH